MTNQNDILPDIEPENGEYFLKKMKQCLGFFHQRMNFNISILCLRKKSSQMHRRSR